MSVADALGLLVLVLFVGPVVVFQALRDAKELLAERRQVQMDAELGRTVRDITSTARNASERMTETADEWETATSGPDPFEDHWSRT